MGAEQLEEVEEARKETKPRKRKKKVVESVSQLQPNERLWTFQEAMQFLGCKKTALYVMVSRKEIPFLRVNNKLRFIPEQLWAWAKRKSAQNAS